MTAGRTRRAKGRRTRAAILARAVDLASVEGLDSLTIGRLAGELGMSKSGLFAHFGSKEELLLATVATARETFVEEVMRPALAAPRGLPRLWSLCAAWLEYAEGAVFPGGCFFTAASAEYDSRPGPVRDAIADTMRTWLNSLERAARMSMEIGHLPPLPPEELVFELNALAMGANWAWLLMDDREAFDRGRRLIRERLEALSLPGAPPLPEVTGRAARERARFAEE
jgi:AcrR family transcriptional regulator